MWYFAHLKHKVNASLVQLDETKLDGSRIANLLINVDHRDVRSQRCQSKLSKKMEMNDNNKSKDKDKDKGKRNSNSNNNNCNAWCICV